MVGTSFSQAAAMVRIPPRMIAPAAAATSAPSSHSGNPVPSCTVRQMALDCIIAPVPAAAKIPITAKHFAIPRQCSTSLSTYMAPPASSPSFRFLRYRRHTSDSAYRVAIPKTPVSQHQNTAPGPPNATAVATPMIFPVPIAAAREVASAPKGEIPLIPRCPVKLLRIPSPVLR